MHRGVSAVAIFKDALSRTAAIFRTAPELGRDGPIRVHYCGREVSAVPGGTWVFTFVVPTDESVGYFLSPYGLGRLVPLRAGLRMRAMRENAVAQTSLGRAAAFSCKLVWSFTPPYICELLRPTTYR